MEHGDINSYTIILYLLAACSFLIIILMSVFHSYNSKIIKSIFDHNQRIFSDFSQLSSEMRRITELAMSLEQSQKYITDIIHRHGQQQEHKIELMRQNLDHKLHSMHEDSGVRLEQIRQTVDEKLQSTLEKRLSESFDVVSRRLELVHRGLGEMQSLASSVGDLKNILSNVKVRGVWGEVQLESILSQILLVSQYDKNAIINPKSAERVEFAIRLPGNEKGKCILLPVDAKFPMSDYEKICAADSGNGDSAVAKKGLDNFVKKSAKSIADKYIFPPYSTDFAIMFIPLESLYAEILQRPGIIEEIQRDYRVVIAGPTTLAAILNSLRMGFRTLAIAERSSEIWEVLEIIKKDFSNFTALLAKTKAKLEQAGDAISLAEKKSHGIESRLVNFSRHEVIEEGFSANEIE